MPRRARLLLPNIPLHLIQRGNNRTACFFAEEDYQFYLHHLTDLASKFDCAVHAYVLMTNHVHLLLTPQKAQAVSWLMKHLGQRYVQYINRTYRRSGTLWEGRFRSCLTQTQDYVLRCYRYIELNPVRAGMVEHPGDYPWSSYRANAQGKPSAGLTPQGEYLALGVTAAARALAYRELFRTELDPEIIREIRASTNGGFVLGADRFKEQIQTMAGRRVARGKAGRPVREVKRRDEEQHDLF